jgi:hypothetical protein
MCACVCASLVFCTARQHHQRFFFWCHRTHRRRAERGPSLPPRSMCTPAHSMHLLRTVCRRARTQPEAGKHARSSLRRDAIERRRRIGAAAARNIITSATAAAAAECSAQHARPHRYRIHGALRTRYRYDLLSRKSLLSNSLQHAGAHARLQTSPNKVIVAVFDMGARPRVVRRRRGGSSASAMSATARRRARRASANDLHRGRTHLSCMPATREPTAPARRIRLPTLLARAVEHSALYV